MSLVEQIGAWADRCDLTPADLARYRVYYAIIGLLTLQNFHWPAGYPDTLYTPPPGPFQLFHGFLPIGVALGLEITLAAAFGLLLFGRWVVAASITVTVIYTFLCGFAYSLNKIDHTIMLEITPAVMALAGWSGRGRVHGVALRLLAFILGLAMFSAALFKAATGWLDPSTHAVRSYMVLYEYHLHSHALFDRVFANMPYGAVWEAIDWTTVILEGSVLFAAFVAWRRFRLLLAVLAVFHLSVLLTMNIGFGSSILAYAAFLPWSRVRLPGWMRVPDVRWPVAAGVTAGVLAWSLSTVFGNAVGLEEPVVLGGAAAIGLWHLSRTAARTIRRRPVAAMRNGADEPAEDRIAVGTSG